MIFYEAPHKLPATLRDMLEVFGDRELALVRELTKLHEEAIRTTLAAAAERFAAEAPRGEFVVIVGGAPQVKQTAFTAEQAAALARDYVAEGMSASAAAKAAAAETDVKKSEIYRLLVEE